MDRRRHLPQLQVCFMNLILHDHYWADVVEGPHANEGSVASGFKTLLRPLQPRPPQSVDTHSGPSHQGRAKEMSILGPIHPGKVQKTPRQIPSMKHSSDQGAKGGLKPLQSPTAGSFVLSTAQLIYLTKTFF